MNHDLALVAVQLELTLADFETEASFRAKIERAARNAADACGGADHRLMVFPEGTGHFIPLIEAPRAARARDTLQAALAILAARHPVRVFRSMWRGRTRDLEKAVMLTVTPTADQLMRDVFAGVARRHRAYVVAGSHLRAVEGLVTNTSYTFSPDGSLLASTSKINLVPALEDDRPGGIDLARGSADALPVVDADFGRLATLICYDGFFKPHTRDEPLFAFMGDRVDELHVDVIANPAANPWPWHEPWVHALPGDDRLRGEQWRAEGLPATLAGLHHVRYGVTAHLCAHFFDLHFDGYSEILERRDSGAVEVLARAGSHERGQAVAVRVPVLRAKTQLTFAPAASKSMQ